MCSRHVGTHTSSGRREKRKLRLLQDNNNTRVQKNPADLWRDKSERRVHTPTCLWPGGRSWALSEWLWPVLSACIKGRNRLDKQTLKVYEAEPDPVLLQGTLCLPQLRMHCKRPCQAAYLTDFFPFLSRAPTLCGKTSMPRPQSCTLSSGMCWSSHREIKQNKICCVIFINSLLSHSEAVDVFTGPPFWQLWPF